MTKWTLTEKDENRNHHCPLANELALEKKTVLYQKIFVDNFSIEQNKIIEEISGYAIEFPLDYLRDENLAEVDKTSIKSVGLSVMNQLIQ